MKTQSFQMIDDQPALADAIGQWRRHDALAFDTEFERTRTFFARLALIQVSDASNTTLVDPVAVADLSGVWAILLDPQIEKVFHSGSEDMELLGRLAGAAPRRIFDTQIAAGLAGVGDSLSYGALVTELCDVELSKSQTRSNWLQRPLTEAQLHYAAADVEYLLEVRRQLGERLQRLGRIHWVEEDCERMVQEATRPADPDRLYMDFKLAWKLGPVERGILRDLLAWREIHAREMDLPRRHVLSDEALLDLAREQPTDNRDVARTAGIGRRKAADVADTIANIVREAVARGESDQPAPPPEPLSKSGRALMRRLRDLVARKAKELGIAPNLLTNKKELIAIVRDGTLLPRLQGWRAEVIGQQLQAFREENIDAITN